MTSTRTSNDTHLTQRTARWAFWLNALNGMFFTFAETLTDPNLVLVWFVSRLTSSNVLLGVIGVLGGAGWFLPQLFVSSWAQQQSRQMVIYRGTSLLRLVIWLMLAALLWWVQSPGLLLLLFFVLFALIRVTAGIAGIPFLEITAKTVPVRWRGRLFGLRLLLGGLCALAGSRLVAAVLGGVLLPYPRDYALLIFVAALAAGVGMFVFCLIAEPPAEPRTGARLSVQMGRGWQALHTHPDYRYLLLGRALMFLGLGAIPFYTVLARRTLGAPETAVGDYLAVSTLVKLLINYPIGWLADAKGRRWVLRAAALGWALTALLALGLQLAFQSGALSGLGVPAYWLAYPLFIGAALFSPADWVAGQNMLLDLAPAAERPLFLGYANTLLGVVSLLGGLAGGLVDVFGLFPFFGAAVAINLLAWWSLGRIAAQRNV